MEKNGHMSDKELIRRLLEERDELYRQNQRLQGKVDELSDVESMKSDYEKRIAALESEQNREQQKLEEKLERKDGKITELNTRIANLEKQVEYLKRQIWGKKSERFINPDPLQRSFDFDGLDLLPEEQEAAESARKQVEDFRKIRVKEHEKRQPVRKPLPENLPHEEVHLYPEGYNTEEWELLPDVERSEQLECEPARLYVKVTIRHKAIRKADRSVITANAPLKPIAKSYASPGILAELIMGKYVDHLPFHRQIEMFKRLGCSIPPPTVNDWFLEVADLLRPLYYRLRELVLGTDYIQVDETTIPIVREERHKTVKGYIWLVRSVMTGRLFFHYDHGSRSQKTAMALLRDFQGALQTDGYEVYAMYENKKGVLPLGCWAHARRKFTEAQKNDRERAEYALEQIGLLYEIERKADAEEMDYDQRADLRERLAYPILVAFEKWLVREWGHVLPKSPIGRAIHYTYNIYHKLTRYHLDGRYRIDNNLAENSIRPIACGRKNYLFCGNDDAAEDAAVIYSLMGCCKAAGVDFRKWLQYVLSHIHEYDHDLSLDLADFLPDNLKESGVL